MRFFLISNMFPSDSDPLFGVFVKNFKVELENKGVVFSGLALIKGKTKSPFKKLFRYLFHYLRIIYTFLFNKYELIYVHYLTHHIPVLTLLLPFLRKPLVINVHGSDIIGLKNRRLTNIFAKMVLQKSTLLVVPTSYFKSKVQEYYPWLSPEKIFVSPSGGVNLDKFYCTSEKKDDSFTLGFISRLTEEKGWKVFLDALHLLKKESIEIKALMAGKGPDKNFILERIEQLGLSKNVEFLGLIPQEDLVNIYNRLDLYIFPTFREAESLGLTGLEAMACGLPVIASNIAGPSTYVNHGQNGFLFPPKNSYALAEEIKKFYLMDSINRAKMSQYALKTSLEYGQSSVAFKLKNKLESILETK